MVVLKEIIFTCLHEHIPKKTLEAQTVMAKKITFNNKNSVFYTALKANVDQYFSEWISHKESEAEMNDPVIGVPIKTEVVFQPIAKWILSISVLRSINMQAHVNAN